MLITKLVKLFIFLICCDECASLKVPIVWTDRFKDLSEESVESDTFKGNNKGLTSFYQNDRMDLPAPSSIQHPPIVQQGSTFYETFHPQPLKREYFTYPATKPPFAVNIARYHGVTNPHKLFQSYPIVPKPTREKQQLGQRLINDNVFTPFQKYVKSNSHTQPISNNYEIFHPYISETPHLHALYRDPVLSKVRQDVEDNKNRLQKYEKDAGRENIKKNEYLESPEDTEKNLFPKKSHKSAFEDHKPEKTKAFYEKPSNHDVQQRHNALNKKIKYPIANSPAKVKPADYNPLKERLNVFKNKQHIMFGDNEYPQKNSEEYNEDPEPEGYDIYLHEKEKYKKFRDSLDEDINEALHHDGEPASKNIELSDSKENLQKDEDIENSEEEDFVPVKTYAQVRKSETVKHLPKKAAFEDAVTFDEFLNAPRLKEAVKSTKAQTVYSEEGYEDSAYDHAGEQQHAENDESHEGFLKQKEHSNGAYRTPTESNEYSYENGPKHGRDFAHESTYSDDAGISNERDDYEEASAEAIDDYADNGKAETNSESNTDETGSNDFEYFGNSNEGSKVILYPKNVKVFSNNPQKQSNKDEGQSGHNVLSKRTLNLTPKASPLNPSKRYKAKTSRKKKNKDIRLHGSQLKQGISHESPSRHEVIPHNKQHTKRKKRDTPIFEVPSFNIEGTYLDEKEIEQLAKLKFQKLKHKKSNKYPYYFSKSMPNKFSALKYAEDMKSIPRKTLGGTEFYDSRSSIDCESIEPEVKIPVKDENGKVINEENSRLNDSLNQESPKHKRETEPNEQKHLPKLGGLGDKIDCLKTKYFGDNPLDSPFFTESIVKPLNKETEKRHSSFYDTLEVPLDLLKTVETFNTETQKVPVIIKSELADGSIPGESKNNTDVLTDVLNHIRMDLSTDVDPKHNQIVLMFLTNNTDDAKDKLFQSFTQKDKVVVDTPHVRSRRDTELTNVYFGEKDLKRRHFGQSRKRNAHHKGYNEPTKLEEDSQKDEKGIKSVVEILDVSNDKRRGEPRYEVTYENHKMDSKGIDTEPTIGNHFKLDSIKKKNTNIEIETTTQLQTSKTRPFDAITISPKTLRGNKKFDDMIVDSKKSSVVKSDPVKNDLTKQDVTQRKRIHTITTTTTTSASVPLEEEYDEYEDYEEEEDLPNHEKIKDNINLQIKDELDKKTLSESKDSKSSEKIKKMTNNDDNILKSSSSKHEKGVVPKIEERSIQNKKTTLITDSKSYGNGDEIDGDIEGKINRETVEKLVGGKNTADYLPEYERKIQENLDKLQEKNQTKENKQNINKEPDETEEDDVYSEDEYEDDDDYYYDDEEVDTEKSTNIQKDEQKLNIQTSTTTPGPVLTTISSNIKTGNNDKKNITLDPLEMYKDNNLAKNINKLMDKEGDQFPLHTDVEVFKENFRVDQEPKHGGNYKSEKIVHANDQDTVETGLRLQNTETNRRSAKLLELQPEDHGKTETKPKHLHGGNLRSVHDNRHGKLPSRGRTMAKIIELRESEAPESTMSPKMMHGGNLRAVHENNQRSSRRKLSSKITNEDVTTSSPMSAKNLHGGNLRRRPLSRSSVNQRQSDNSELPFKTRSSLITQKSDPNAMLQIRKQTNDPNIRKVSEPVIRSPSPTLTSTPSYILDPSKRKYFYVDE